MEQEKIFIAADAAKQETLEDGVYTILKRWDSQQATEENYKAMQNEVYNFCRYWFIKNGRPVVKAKIKSINIKCEIF
ncbi:MAG: hypothetical protein J6S61_04360 [Elusimicrobiaceae bacterium]|nr:hypothetical protein [Elusimicrobiaceae bacterium]